MLTINSYQQSVNNFLKTFLKNYEQKLCRTFQAQYSSSFISFTISLIICKLLINYADLVIIQCYGGWRPQELGLIELENVDLDQWIMIGGIKTEAGKNRIVPIHSRIRPLVERRYRQAQELGSRYIFNYVDTDRRNSDIKLTYNRYSRVFERLKNELGLNMNHRPHDGRKHFVTKAKEYNVDEYAIKYIVGHKIMDITEKVYTARETSWLKKEIEKIK